jgi:hypothetical protein
MAFMTVHPPKERAAPLSGPIKTRAEARTIYSQIVAKLAAIYSRAELEIYLMTVGEELIEYKEQLPNYWLGDGADFQGLEKEIRRAWNRVTADW